MAVADDTAFLGTAWWAELKKAGTIPPQVRRMVIDISMDQPVRIYYECFGDDATIEPAVMHALEYGEKLRFEPKGS